MPTVDQAEQVRSPLGKGAAWVGNHLGQFVVGVAVTLATPFVAGWISPQDVRDTVERVTGTSPSAPPPAAATIRLRAVGASDETQRLAEAVRPEVISRLRTPGTTQDGSYAFRLSGLELARGTNRRSTIDWIVALPGSQQLQCGPVDIAFYSNDTLADAIATRLNASMAASAQSGRNRCD